MNKPHEDDVVEHYLRWWKVNSLWKYQKLKEISVKYYGTLGTLGGSLFHSVTTY